MKRLTVILGLTLIHALWGQSPKADLPTAVILCYDTDKLITRACDEIEKKLNRCETGTVKIIRQNSPSEDSIRSMAKSNSVPPQSLVFVVGHGLADADQSHYIATKNFWKDHPEKVNKDKLPQLLEEGLLIKGKTLNSLISKVTPSPAMWYLSCHSGGNCTEGGNVGASCSSWETTAISYVKSLVRLNFKLDPTTRKLINLLCEPNLFETFDKNKNGFIDGNEWLEVFVSDHEKETSIPTSAVTPKGQETILKQTANENVCLSDEKLIITQKRCANAAGPLDEPCLFSPVLSHFALPRWDKQKAPLPLLERHSPTTPSSH